MYPAAIGTTNPFGSLYIMTYGAAAMANNGEQQWQCDDFGAGIGGAHATVAPRQHHDPGGLLKAATNRQ